MDSRAMQIFLRKLESRKQSVKQKLFSLADELFSELTNEFQTRAQLDAQQHLPQSLISNDQQSSPPVPPITGVHVETSSTKIQLMLLNEYEQLFTDYEQSVELSDRVMVDLLQDVVVSCEISAGGEEIVGTTNKKPKSPKAKATKRNPRDRALILMNKPTRHRPFYCKWPGCEHRAVNHYNAIKHVRTKHYHLPLTRQEQTEAGIEDPRDPLRFVGELTADKPDREVVPLTADDLREPEGCRRKPERQFRCLYPNCEAAFAQKLILDWHHRSHSGVKPFRCTYPDCDFAAIKRTCVKRHIRTKHFRLPKTLKRQEALQLIDTRDPDEYIAEDPELMSLQAI